MSKPFIQTCEECDATATVFAIDETGPFCTDGMFLCDACRQEYEDNGGGAGGMGKVHNGWRVLLTGLGGSSEPSEDRGPNLEEFTLVEIECCHEWFAVLSDETENAGPRNQSARKAIEAWVDDFDCEVIEILEPGKPTREEAIEAARGMATQEERERAVRLLDQTLDRKNAEREAAVARERSKITAQLRAWAQEFDARGELPWNLTEFMERIAHALEHPEEGGVKW